MKNVIRKILTDALASLARSIIQKYHPRVVMITGSVGKTSTKEAVAAVLSEKFFVRKSEKSFNSELGVPLTILGAKNPWSNPFAWFTVFRKGYAMLGMDITYPEMLVLEVGADKPGDLAGILKIVKPDSVVVTLLPSVPVHVEFYKDPGEVHDEEFLPALSLNHDASSPLVICADDEYAVQKAHDAGIKFTSYGVSEDATVRIENIEIWQEDSGEEGSKAEVAGMQASLRVKGSEDPFPIKVRGAIGRVQLFAPAAAIAIGIALGMSVPEALDGLAEYVSPPGRARIFEGKRNTLLIDDTYNSSPAAAEEILKSLDMLPKESRRIAVLGDMLELGPYSEAEHTRIGHIASDHAEVIITVGEKAKAIADAAMMDGVVDVHEYKTSQEAAAHIEQLIQKGDIILVKGSQGVRMERILRPLLEHIEDASELVRQDAEWQKR